MSNNKTLRHLIVADFRMRELFGFYWHRRHDGISEQRIGQLVKEIKVGEKIIKQLKGKS